MSMTFSVTSINFIHCENLLHVDDMLFFNKEIISERKIFPILVYILFSTTYLLKNSATTGKDILVISADNSLFSIKLLA